jgi:DNA polymerase
MKMKDKEEKISELSKEVKSCKKCELWKTRKNPVVGSGNLNSKIMFIGEAPGFNEDLQGKPFVGKAGKVLDELLASIGLKRKDVYIGNVLKCRPPNNRDPKPEEIQACTPYLDRQISIIEPKILVTLGNFSTSYVLEKFGFKPESIGKIHGKVFDTRNILGQRILPSYHPAVATYNPNTKIILMEDFRVLKDLIK